MSGKLKTYRLCHAPNALTSQPIIISGTSGPDAVSRYNPDDVAMYVRGSLEHNDYSHVVHQVVVNDAGTRYRVGPLIAVKRLQPRIERVR